MRWCVVRHPDLPGLTAVIAESALFAHQARGWFRVSDWTDDRVYLDPRQYVNGHDLDAAKPGKTPTKPAENEPAKTAKTEAAPAEDNTTEEEKS